MKHKSEPDYNATGTYTNFYPVEIDFGNDTDSGKIKFELNNSHYTSEYWKDPAFPDMQSVFSSFFKDDFREEQNKK